MNDGGPAYPSSDIDKDPRNPGWIGGAITKRDYFAAKVMGAAVSAIFDRMIDVMPADKVQVLASNLASLSYQMADAMLAEREKAVTP